MKRIICLVLILCSICPMVNAQVVGMVCATDIHAYIDYMHVPSYNVGGNTVVMVRDLENYGFTVTWNAASKTVNFYRDFSKPVTPLVPAVETRPVGAKVYDVYATDIRTFYRGTEIPSYNIGGSTAVRLRDIATVGGVQFDAANRRADVFTREPELFSEELAYIKTNFYGSLLFLSQADNALYPIVSMLESGVYNAQTVATYRAFFNSMLTRFQSFQSYREPYGFSESAQELWWAMVNMRYAGETVLVMSNTLQSGGSVWAAMEDYKQFRIDSLEQRRRALLALDAEMQALTLHWE